MFQCIHPTVMHRMWYELFSGAWCDDKVIKDGNQVLGDIVQSAKYRDDIVMMISTLVIIE